MGNGGEGGESHGVTWQIGRGRCICKVWLSQFEPQLVNKAFFENDEVYQLDATNYDLLS